MVDEQKSWEGLKAKPIMDGPLGDNQVAQACKRTDERQFWVDGELLPPGAASASHGLEGSVHPGWCLWCV